MVWRHGEGGRPGERREEARQSGGRRIRWVSSKWLMSLFLPLLLPSSPLPLLRLSFSPTHPYPTLPLVSLQDMKNEVSKQAQGTGEKFTGQLLPLLPLTLSHTTTHPTHTHPPHHRTHTHPPPHHKTGHEERGLQASQVHRRQVHGPALSTRAVFPGDAYR